MVVQPLQLGPQRIIGLGLGNVFIPPEFDLPVFNGIHDSATDDQSGQKSARDFDPMLPEGGDAFFQHNGYRLIKKIFHDQ
jgi:hypothetical protein